MELGAEIGAIVVVADFVFKATDLGQLHRLVEGDLGLGGLLLEGGVPGAAVSPLKRLPSG